MKHPHDQLIRAWLDGRVVQYRDGDLWVDIESAATVSKSPHWYAESEYRLKPVVLRYRVGITASLAALIVNSLEQAHKAEKAPGFSRWITDWTEVIL